MFSYRLLAIVNDWDDNDTIWLYKSTGHTTKTEEDEGRYEEGEVTDAYSLLQHMIPIVHHGDLFNHNHYHARHDYTHAFLSSN